MTRPHPYIPEIGKAVVKQAAAAPDRPLTDLSLNESSYGASPLAAAAAAARAKRLHRYPDPVSTALREAIGRRYDLDPDKIVCGNGSEELLDAVGRIYARPGDEILFTEYGFMQFPIVAMRVGATSVTAPERELVADVDALLAQVSERTRIVFIANPNNPSGTYITADAMRRLAAGLPRSVVLVIDSAYAEYVDAADYSAGMELVDNAENVIVTRTFSKAFGLAALRVGWGYCAASMAGVINRIRGIGNVNAIAQEAAIAALDDGDFVRRVRDDTAAERLRLSQALTEAGLAVVPSVTNFVMVRFATNSNHTAGAAQAHLLADGIVVRTADDYGLGDHLRITLGLPAENDAVIDALRTFLV